MEIRSSDSHRRETSLNPRGEALEDSNGETETKNAKDIDADSGRMQHTMETEIIPRLLMSCRDVHSSRSSPFPGADSAKSTIEEFAGYLIADDFAKTSRYLTSLRRQGASLEGLYLDLFGPAAQYIGYLWEQDICDFVDVTLGVGHLQRFVRELSPEFQDFQGTGDSRRRALLLPIPGEQHTFGLTLMAEFFRRAGWDVQGWPLAEDTDLVNLARTEWFAVIGISVGGEVSLAGLRSLIERIRPASRNPSVGIMVGGPILERQPRLAKQVGADASALDARQAVAQAEALLDLIQESSDSVRTPPRLDGEPEYENPR